MKNPNQDTYNKIAAIYTKEMDERMAWQRNLEEFAALLPENAEIVELGCGSGREAGWLAQHITGSQVTGIDFAAEMIRLAQENHVPHTTFIEGDLTTYIHSKPADGIWARGTLHHLTPEELLRTFNHAADYLKPTGIFCCINKYGHGDTVYKTSRYGDPVDRYFNFFNEEMVEQVASESGLKIENQYQISNDEQSPYLVSYLKIDK